MHPIAHVTRRQLAAVGVSLFLTSDTPYEGMGGATSTANTEVVVDPRDFGAVGDGVHDDTCALNAAIASITSGTVKINNGRFRVTSNLELKNKTGFKLLGNGAVLELEGDGSSAGGLGIRLCGRLKDVEIAGLCITGDGVPEHGHKGIWGSSGADLTKLLIRNNHVNKVTVGISINAEMSGSVKQFRIERNNILDVNGISSGRGYGIHVASDGRASYGQISHNTILRSQRHGIYIAHTSYVSLTHNQVIEHRTRLTSAEECDPLDGKFKLRPAINIARSHNIRVLNNEVRSAQGGFVALIPSPEGRTDIRMWDIQIAGNVFKLPRDRTPMLTVGDPTNPTVTGVPRNIVIRANEFVASYAAEDGVSAPDIIQQNAGVRVLYDSNRLEISGVNAPIAGIVIRELNKAPGDRSLNRRLRFSRNYFRFTGSAERRSENVATRLFGRLVSTPCTIEERSVSCTPPVATGRRL